MILLFMSALAHAEPAIGPWEPIFAGVELAEGAQDDPLIAAWGVRIALGTEGVDFVGTPSNGEDPEETTGQTAGAFLEATGAQVGINANFYAPCCIYGPEEPKQLLGLVVTDGEVVSPPEEGGGFAPTLWFDGEGRAYLEDVGPETDLTPIVTAVSGNRWLVRDGEIVAPDGDRNPRTAVGLDATGEHLVLVVIDGRNTEHSVGTSDVETAEWMLAFGAHDAINLDGGGSTTLVLDDDGLPVVLNQPSWFQLQRTNANHLGVRAGPYVPPLDPEPEDAPSHECGCDMGPIAVPWWLLVVLVARRSEHRARGAWEDEEVGRACSSSVCSLSPCPRCSN